MTALKGSESGKCRKWEISAKSVGFFSKSVVKRMSAAVLTCAKFES